MLIKCRGGCQLSAAQQKCCQSQERNKRRLLVSWPKGAAAVLLPRRNGYLYSSSCTCESTLAKASGERERASAPPAQHIHKMLRRAIACNERVISGFNCWTADRRTDTDGVFDFFAWYFIRCGWQVNKSRRMTSIPRILCASENTFDGARQEASDLGANPDGRWL